MPRLVQEAGRMGGNRALLDATDWAATPLGPQALWPADMRAVVDMAMASGFPVCTAWGDDGILLYNDAYNPIFGDKHPAAFGRPTRAHWQEIWEFLGPAIDQVRRTREPLTFQDTLLPLIKHARPEECWFDFSYSAVGDGGERALGVISIAVEKTRDVILARRHAACDIPLDAMANGNLQSLSEVLAQRLQANPMDAAAAALVRLDSVSGGPADVLLQLGEWPELASLARLSDVRDGGARHVPAEAPGRPPEIGEQVAVLPLLGERGQPVAVLALAPHALVVAEGHLEFASTLGDRLQRVLAHADRLGAYREHIAEQDTLYRFLFDNILDAVVYARTDGGAHSPETIVAANPGACQLFGYAADELPGMTRDQLIFQGDAQFQEALQYREATRSFAGELTFRRKDGSPVLAEVGSRLVTSRDGSIHSVNILRDASVRARAHAERARQARFEAIAQLTSGMAHDFNNLLTVVQGSLELLMEDLPAGARARDYAANALLCAERGASLTGQLLAYARRQLLRLQAEDLNARIRELLPLMQTTAGTRIEVVLDLQEALPPCRTDTAQLTTALLNLAANGRDAMPDGGRLTVQTRHAADDPGMVVLRVSDTGHGIPDALRDRIFEPYFTTKALGAGLGLAMVQGFVHQSGGQLHVHAPAVGGACFELRLPVAEMPLAAPARPALPAANPGGRILLVDDNPLIREQTRERLVRAGYEVATAQDSEDALAQLQEANADLLLTDLDMPGALDGVQLTREVRARWPELPVVVMTGHDPLSLAALQGYPRLLGLAKPFDRAGLLAAIASLLAPTG